MELKLVEKTQDEIAVAFLDNDEAFVYLLLEELWKDEKVISADYKKIHPTLEWPILRVKVSEGKPQTALKRASKSLSNKFEELKAEFVKVSG